MIWLELASSLAACFFSFWFGAVVGAKMQREFGAKPERLKEKAGTGTRLKIVVPPFKASVKG